MEPIPDRMRAVLLTGNGGYDELEMRDDVPVPGPGPGEVLVRVGAAGVNNTDINTRIGWYSQVVTEATEGGSVEGFANAGDDGWSGAVFRFPRIQGADACGRIVAVGANVDPSRIGERVLIEPVFQGRKNEGPLYFGSEVDGAFAEYTLAPSPNAHAIVSPLSDAELASFPCAYSAAENMITRLALTSGERVLVTGASGGVGSAAVQLAKCRGASVTALSGAEKAEAVRKLGADIVVPRDAVLSEAFGSDAFDAAIDVVGGSQFPSILQCLKPGGRYAVAGAISGPIVSLDLRILYLKDLRLLGCTILEPEVFPNLVRYIERGELAPLVAATFPLADIVKAQQCFLEKRHVGKIVLIP